MIEIVAFWGVWRPIRPLGTRAGQNWEFVRIHGIKLVVPLSSRVKLVAPKTLFPRLRTDLKDWRNNFTAPISLSLLETPTCEARKTISRP